MPEEQLIFDEDELDVSNMVVPLSEQFAKAFSQHTNPINSPPLEPKYDAVRLNGQMKDIFNIMKYGAWRTLGELKDQLGRGTETGISAAVRSFRKDKYGSHTVNRRRRGDPKSGLWEYQLLVNRDG